VHRDRGDDAHVIRLLDYLEIARHFLRRIGKRLFHLQSHHPAKVRWIDRGQAQTLGKNRVHRERKNDVVAVLQ
jgi:hypothetical protein